LASRWWCKINAANLRCGVLAHIIADHLTTPKNNNRHSLKDQFVIKLMFTLSKTELYRKNLLFRDYSKESAEVWEDFILPNGNLQKLHTESIYYVQAVLGRRLTIVAKRKSFPTNLHFLLLMLCRYSLDNNWLKTRIKRKPAQIACINAPFFQTIEKILKRQCQQLKNIGAVSKTYREQYGTLSLIVGENRAEVVEEISLFDVIEAVPAPLTPAIQKLPVWYVPLVEHILISLNENYGLLRSCGLSPQEWGEEISIGKLRELKKLKKMADNYLKLGTKKTLYTAYQQAFLTLQQDKGKIAGFVDFLDFAHSKVGVTLLQVEFVPLFSDDEESENLCEKIVAPEYNSVEMENGLEKLLVDYARSFSPLTAYFFKQALILQRPLQGENGVLNDAGFLTLVAVYEDYVKLEPDQLADKLIQKIKVIIAKYSHFDNPTDWLTD
jgi:hypothetical protein